jgi:DNA-directed RNA polymerase specialized sigma24 family protein
MSKGKFEKATKENYTLAEIEKALKNEALMYAYAEAGDLDVVHLLIDAETALQMANPTDIQLKTVELVYRKGYSLVEAGKALEVTPQAVKFNLDLLRVKIKKVLDEWKVADREGASV